MQSLLPGIIGLLFAISIYLMLQRHLLKLVIGLVMLSNAANLIIFAAGRLTRANPPLIPEGASMPAAPFANPLPQALILTAIVISFGLLAFALVLLFRVYGELGTMDSDDLGEEPATEAAAEESIAEMRPAPEPASR